MRVRAWGMNRSFLAIPIYKRKNALSSYNNRISLSFAVSWDASKIGSGSTSCASREARVSESPGSLFGAPSSWAATPPTTKKSTPWRRRTRRSPRNLTLCDSAMPELGEPVHPILLQLEPFERRQAEGPPNQGEIDSVRRLLRQEGRLVDVRLPGRLGHGNTIAQPPVRERCQAILLVSPGGRQSPCATSRPAVLHTVRRYRDEDPLHP